MRPVHLADIETAARVLMRVAPADRCALMQEMLAQVDAADIYRQRSGRPHPRFGNGTLMSLAHKRKMALRPVTLGADALDAYGVVLAALKDRLSHQIP